VTFSAEGEDVPKLLDFGIAKVSGTDGNNNLTRTGTIYGTPFYMAPEQALGQIVDERADVYAMGVIMYEVFCGSVPFQGESFMGILTQHITAEPKAPSQMAAEHGRTIPPGVEEIIQRAMRKDPDQRFLSMDELVQALVAAYRGVAGSGMSSYLQAHAPPPGSRGNPAATAMLSPAVVQQNARPGAASSSPPVGPSATPLPYHPAQSGPAAAHYPPHQPQHQRQPSMPASADASSPYMASYPAGSSASESMVVPRKSRTGLIVALLVLLLAAGGGAAAFVVMNQESGADADSTAQTDPTQDGEQVQGGGDGLAGTSGQDGHVGGGAQPPMIADAGAAKTPEVPPPLKEDPKVDPKVDSKVDPKVDPKVEPKPETKSIIVNSTPQKAEVYGPDGTRLGVTPALIEVEVGKPLELTLKRKRYQNQTVTVDGSKKKETFALRRIPSGSGSHGSGSSSGTSGGSGAGDKPPPKKSACEKDAASVACDCEKNPSLDVCGLE
jgi:serine/threonine-protein kinase